jgi:hypothetical protein
MSGRPVWGSHGAAAGRYHRPVADARFHPRLHIAAHADVIGSEVLLARPVGDISLGGCKFEGVAWEDPGTAVTLILTFPDCPEEQVPLSAVVVRAGDGDMAVRFQNLSDEQRELLRKCLDEGVELPA